MLEGKIRLPGYQLIQFDPDPLLMGLIIVQGEFVVPRRLHICLVSQSYLPFHGGITEHVWHLSRTLAQRGHRVTILTGNPRSEVVQNEADPDNVQVLRVGTTCTLPSHGSRACVTFGLPWQKKLRQLRNEAIDVTHLQSPLEPFLPLWALKNLPGVKIGTFHTGGKKQHWGYQRFSGKLSGFASDLDRQLAVSSEAKRFVESYFPGRYEIIPNGVDLTRFHPLRHPSVHRRQLQDGADAHLLYVGRLDPRKGLETLLAALGRFCQTRALRCHPASGPRLPKLKLVIVGDGPKRKHLERIARERELPVTFLGPVERDILPECYRDADIFVAPSADGESFGISLLEAMASGLPIVASDIAGYRETLSGSEAALHFTPGSDIALSRCLESLLGSNRLRLSLGRSGHSFVQNFSWERITDRVEQVYYEALGIRYALPERSSERVQAKHIRPAAESGVLLQK